MLPITSAGSQQPTKGTGVVIGLGSVAVGSGMVWLGTEERHKALQPQTTFGIFLGRNNGVQIRRRRQPATRRGGILRPG
jgi:hypothetical protein